MLTHPTDPSAEPGADGPRLSRLRALAQVFDVVGDGIWEWDLSAGRLSGNRRWHDLLGLDPERDSHPDAAYRDLVHPEDEALRQACVDACFEQRGPYRIELRLRRDDGAVQWVAERGAVVELDGEGRPLRMVGSLRDITDRRRAEAALRQREQQLRSVIESALDGILTVDARHRVVMFNEAAARMFGVPSALAIGQPLDRFLPVVGEPSLPDEAAPARGPGPLRALVGRRVDGTEFPIEASIARSGQGEDLLLTAVVRDTSELRLAQTALREKALAEEANRAKSDFLSRVSHELRTPLNAILGFAQLLETDRDEPLSPVQRQRAELIRLAGARLLNLINDLLDLTKIEQGVFEVERTPLDLGRAVGQAIDLIRPEAARRELSVVLEPMSAPLHVMADPRALDQVLLNLLSNAVKYNRTGGAIRVQARREGRQVALAVSDTGEGIPPARLDQLFQPFNRLGAQATRVPGTGLGLAIALQLARLMGADLRAHSLLGQGTTMTLRLPWTRQAPEAPAGPESAFLQTDWIDELPGHVLYIEDDPVNAILMEQIVCRMPGWTIDVVGNAEEGLRRSASGAYTIVLTDMNLPDIQGLQVIAALRAAPVTARARIVAVSADALPQQIDAALQAGADDYWTKPLDPAMIRRRLRRA